MSDIDCFRAWIAVTNSHDADQLKPADTVVPHLDELTMADLQQICA
jgi:hypothetical protein